MLMLRGVGPGDVKEPEHAEAAAGTILPYTRGVLSRADWLC